MAQGAALAEGRLVQALGGEGEGREVGLEVGREKGGWRVDLFLGW